MRALLQFSTSTPSVRAGLRRRDGYQPDLSISRICLPQQTSNPEPVISIRSPHLLQTWQLVNHICGRSSSRMRLGHHLPPVAPQQPTCTSKKIVEDALMLIWHPSSPKSLLDLAPSGSPFQLDHCFVNRVGSKACETLPGVVPAEPPPATVALSPFKITLEYPKLQLFGRELEMCRTVSRSGMTSAV